MRDRSQWETLAERPSDLAGAAAEESLRYDAPVVQSWEVAFEDTEIGGYPIVKGKQYFRYLAPATTIPPDSSIQMTLTYREKTTSPSRSASDPTIAWVQR